MGDPKFQRKKYKGPTHPWEATRIKEEEELLKEYGLRNKKEIWRMRSLLKSWHTQAKEIVALPKEKREEMLSKIFVDISSDIKVEFREVTTLLYGRTYRMFAGKYEPISPF